MVNEKKRDINRLLKFFIIPTGIIVLLLLFVYPSFQRSGLLYLASIGLTLVIYQTILSRGKKRDSVVGIKKNIFAGVASGVVMAVGFIFLSWVSPAFTIGVPPVPVSAASQVKAFIVIILAPISEEALFRGALLSLFINFYGIPFGIANLIQSLLFSATHLLVYGVFLEQLDKLIDVFGQVQAVSGMFIAAFVFAVIAGLIVHKWKNLMVTMTGHSSINAWLFAFVTALVTFG